MTTPLKIPSATLARLAKLGIHHRADLLLHLPLRYEDETELAAIETLVPGETVQVQGVITHNEVTFRPRRTLVCRIQDKGGELYLRFLNFYPSQIKLLAVEKQIRAIGEVRMGYYGLEMVHPKCRTVGEDTPLKTSLTPIYPTTAGLSQSTLRKYITNALDVITPADPLPKAIRKALHLWEFLPSIKLLHNPTRSSSTQEAHNHEAWRRIKFDELLAQQLSMRVHHQERGKRLAPALKISGRYIEKLLSIFPFELTPAQKKVFSEISHDLSRPHPTQRLLLGDVGSGKTIVAAMAALQAIEQGYQVALMSPTEILAEQHFLKLSDWFAPLGITPVWLSGSQKKKEKCLACEKIATGITLLAIGTHALFQEQVTFHKLGLVIVDEQHKFGVQQRLALQAKGKQYSAEPHQLMMSATPIPRTLAMSYYADLDVSIIDELPPGRTPVITKLVSDARRDEVLERVRAACLEGQQAYWVCPLINESEALQLQNALETHQLLTETFPELRTGLIHGKMDSSEKIRIMSEFMAGELQLLVATTVIEVGVDVPNASLMVIDHAERMGLAQLHQLRGRVGRGSAQSLCILLYSKPLSDLARTRLKIIFENTDGFVIAQQDLQLRGPGELLGARQSGVAMLRFADIDADEDLLKLARQVADQLLRDFPDAARAYLHRWMANKHDYLHV
ncbi:MAG: ATP-dependent DNA helicase RecG [Gallionella sp.]